MKERVSYDEYYNKDRVYVYKDKRGVEMFKVCLLVAGAGVIGYYFGYKKARGTAKDIFNGFLSKCTDGKEGYKDLWNMAVDEHFEKK